MESYQEIRILPHLEFQQPMLMAALFARLHLALAARRSGDIGISFPEYGKTPGGVLRLHGCQQALEELDATRWHAGFQDYCSVAAIAPVPAVAGWRTVNRVQVKSNAERLMRRSVRKGWLTEEEAEQRVAQIRTQSSSLPFLPLKSLSNGQHFRLFICHGELQTSPVTGTFSSYGLSGATTIPWF
ncbi:type I-F CRISPR-associated endoribonuclease Cas6/Csy4 [Buttiauxella warmboldiae]|uniref:Type I-F CRISPR-associated endoribonuclease Cas6/Csy4 n=1 Tax=Buttiauxella warmboldiae TaxID=82993 RepID=A0A3N5E765_9ENTR|nr:type I-F CRISPR-associated endoribonuclease Cas6/Csy4 [Buttiauxella warmboldiae]RPH26906.1 type I-F CRISPR-associated endoribonuclease Cas6/Csy4 [Buttiauxella warmboldiae]